MSPQEQGFFTVVDLKRYAYCPRIVFITSVLHLEERTSEAMEMGVEEHDENFITPLLARLRASRVLRSLELESPRLGLSGKLDYLVVTSSRELVPVEVKWSEPLGGKARWDHRVQLAAYALLVEENLGLAVKRGYVYYLRVRKLVEVLIDEDIRTIVRRILRRMHEMVLEERDPGVMAPLSRCVNCGYLYYCRPGLDRSSVSRPSTELIYKEKRRSEGPGNRLSGEVAENGEVRRSAKKASGKDKYNFIQKI